MNIEYVGRAYHIDDSIRHFAEDKLQKVLKFLEDPIEIRLTLEAEKHLNVAELHVHHRFGSMQAADQTGEMLEAVGGVIEKIEKQARRSRKKHYDQRRRRDRTVTDEFHWPVEVLEGGELDSGAARRSIKSTRLSIKPMSVEDAAMSLQASKNEFLVFRNAEKGETAVLYKRKDGNYGLISPEA